MQFVRDFVKIDKNDVALAGGKGASLGELTQAGISVPLGFVILATAFEKFLEETDLNVEIDAILHSVNHKEVHTVDNASEKIKALILGAEISEDISAEIKKFFKNLNSKYVAVRSSATAEDSSSAAWAGQLESYLNTTEETLLENVKKCWASLFTPRAIFYRFEKDPHKQKISVAVVVQKMVESEKSGIAFSVHPVTQDRNQLIIEAGLGLGEAIVSGQITPDSYVVEKQPWRIIDKNIQTQSRGLYRAKSVGNEWRNIPKAQGEKQVLSDKEILELSEMILQIEAHYDFPCDIEWAFEKGKIYIVQSRPITTLSKTQKNIIQPNEYQLLFQIETNYLISDLFAQHYKNLWCLLILKNGFWKSFISVDVVKDTLDEGFGIYSNINKFREFKSEFENYRNSSPKKLEEMLSQKLSSENIKEYLYTISEVWKYYSKTEFFYTDKAAGQLIATGDSQLKNNLKELEQIKNDGRTFMNSLIFTENCYLDRLLSLISKETGISKDNLKWCGIEEISKFTKLGYKEIARRKKFFAMIGGGNELEYIYSESKEFDKFFLFDDKKEIRGTIANKGIVQGKVKVIPQNYYADFSILKKIFEDMNKGDVLVAETTSPELMPACLKAGAIITNQGGLLSHAAIVSREMNIPCVIGTGNATEILKDGDLVEVDGNSGVVKILK